MTDGKTLIAQAIAKAEQRLILEQNKQIAEILGMKVFAGPSVPNGERNRCGLCCPLMVDEESINKV